MRGILTTLPFKVIPRDIIVHAVVFSVMWINFFPPKGGVSQFLSPQTIVTGLTADAEKHCKTPFGGYAHVHAEPTPGNDALTSRTVGGISLGPTGNIKGTYKFLSILTGKLIKARSFTPLPMPEEVINLVEGMEAYNEMDEFGIPYNLPQATPLTVFDDISLSVDDSQISEEELADVRNDPARHEDSMEESSTHIKEEEGDFNDEEDSLMSRKSGPHRSTELGEPNNT
jgi:hypothetical protein